MKHKSFNSFFLCTISVYVWQIGFECTIVHRIVNGVPNRFSYEISDVFWCNLRLIQELLCF